ncbi:MAG: hypothetical protein HY728_01225 [Candidatus Rokubacteria bacterium]|nr:hypothetical protein [Candidatus Rokubacteria bacterium]MBI4592812.1 hypothetical protein [Candidatus Rokubacteria bacterium]
MLVPTELLGGLTLLISAGFLAVSGTDLVRVYRRVSSLERQTLALRARIKESLDVRVP